MFAVPSSPESVTWPKPEKISPDGVDNWERSPLSSTLFVVRKRDRKICSLFPYVNNLPYPLPLSKENPNDSN
jgi:hypothetical protein